jgi:hypothetical protein
MVTLKSVSTIVDLAKKSQYLALVDIANGGLLGGGVDIRLPQKIYWNRKSVERVQSLDGIYSEVRATATITIDAIGTTGDTIEPFVNDPELGQISLGLYTQLITDTTPLILAASIRTELSNNAYDYTISVDSATITITAPPNYGATINGDDRLDVDTSAGDIEVTVTQFSGGVTASTGDENLRKCANYLYWLCGGYALTAQGISGTGGVAPIVANFDLPAPYDFTVTNTSFIIAGQQSKSIPNFIGYNLLFIRGGIVQSQNDQGDGSSYFTWNANTGLLNVYPEAALTEQFLIYAQI